MAHTSLISPALAGQGSRRTARRSASKRRRLIVALLLVLVVGLSVVVNYGPLTAYRSARARLDTATAQVNDLQTQKD